MLRLVYSPDFVRTHKKFSHAFKEEIKERIEEFRNIQNHQKLKVHKLNGRMKGLYSFSINHRDRVVFEWSKDKKTAYLIDIGDHSIYE
jgi:plasmid maintenance system killer protein